MYIPDVIFIFDILFKRRQIGKIVLCKRSINSCHPLKTIVMIQNDYVILGYENIKLHQIATLVMGVLKGS